MTNAFNPLPSTSALFIDAVAPTEAMIKMKEERDKLQSSHAQSSSSSSSSSLSSSSSSPVADHVASAQLDPAYSVLDEDIRNVLAKKRAQEDPKGMQELETKAETVLVLRSFYEEPSKQKSPAQLSGIAPASLPISPSATTLRESAGRRYFVLDLKEAEARQPLKLRVAPPVAEEDSGESDSDSDDGGNDAGDGSSTGSAIMYSAEEVAQREAEEREAPQREIGRVAVILSEAKEAASLGASPTPTKTTVSQTMLQSDGFAPLRHRSDDTGLGMSTSARRPRSGGPTRARSSVRRWRRLRAPSPPRAAPPSPRGTRVVRRASCVAFCVLCVVSSLTLGGGFWQAGAAPQDFAQQQQQAQQAQQQQQQPRQNANLIHHGKLGSATGTPPHSFFHVYCVSCDDTHARVCGQWGGPRGPIRWVCGSGRVCWSFPTAPRSWTAAPRRARAAA